MVNLRVAVHMYMLMRDEEGRKKQARSYKQQGKATHVHVAQCGELPTLHVMYCMYMYM